MDPMGMGSFTNTLTYSAKAPWNKSFNFIFPIKYVIPKSLKVGHWLSQLQKLKLIAKIQNDVRYKLQHAVRVIQSTHLGLDGFQNMSTSPILDKRNALNSGIDQWLFLVPIKVVGSI